MNDKLADQTGSKFARSFTEEVKSVLSGRGYASGTRQATQEKQGVEELMLLPTQIDQEVNDRLSQNLCLMLADVVGSTSFYQTYGDVQGRLFVQRHHDILSPLVTVYEGRVVKTIGDAVMASFDEPGQALDCSVAMQQMLWKANQQDPEAPPLRTKISLHYGSALVEANDIFGDLVNMSARLNSLAEPDQLLISEEVYDRVQESTNLPLLPLDAVPWKEGEKGLIVYEVLWQQQPEVAGETLVFRDFAGINKSCFYCGLREHQVTQCPSKQLDRYVGRLERLGYLPLPKILRLFQQEDLSTVSPVGPPGGHIFDAFYEVSLSYQLRFLIRVWLANNEDWRQVERHQLTTSPMAGTRLWKGFDCLRVGRLDDAHPFLLAALESNPDDYKAYVALGFWAMEKADPFTALKYWRKSLSLVNNDLQRAYLHLLMHRLYEVSDKTELAQQELQKALAKDSYLHEARYRRIALLVKADKDDEILPQLQKLIQDDRTVYLKVLLDPAFAPLRTQLVPLLSKLLREAQSAAIKQIRHVSQEINSLRDWYQQPEAKLVAVERAVGSLRQHMRRGSYFGYLDVVYEGDILVEKIQKLVARRKSYLRNEYTILLHAVRSTLRALASFPQFSADPRGASPLVKHQKELVRLQSMGSLHTGNRFWRAWKELQALETALKQLDPSLQHHGFIGGLGNRKLRRLVLFALGGGVIAATTLFGIIGYLSYFSRLHLQEQQLPLFLILGGSIIGSGAGWFAHWYRSRP